MARLRLDQALVQKGLAPTRSQAEHYIKLGYVQVDGKPATKPHQPVEPQSSIVLNLHEQYVSRAALKLASVVDAFKLDFKDKVVLDVGSSTGGFTDYALRHGAMKVIAVDVGSDQMHPSLKNDPRIELHEKTDIRNFQKPRLTPDIVLIDVSFISLREVLPAVVRLAGTNTRILAMCKPQFEAGAGQVSRGVVKNDTIRRRVLKEFEDWAKQKFLIRGKADSAVAGSKGNLERFYLLKRM